MAELREYQKKAIRDLYQWFEKNPYGNPCLVLPTGSGKSHVVAELCRDAVQSWPETRILMLTHVKELIEQNAEKLRQHWPNAPMGIYSAGLGQRNLGEPITFAGIQSIRTKAYEIGHVDLCIIDECHLVSHKDEGGYRTLLNQLRDINPNLRVIGLTATPYRLGHGLITDEPAIFDDLIEPVSIEQLVYLKYLAPLRSKKTDMTYDVSGVHKRGGEYIEAELAKKINTDAMNLKAVSEVIRRAGDRKAWLFFCTGVDHARAVANILNASGIKASCVTGETSPKERQRIISDFRSGEIKALTNANVLTTGFDYPDIDLIALMRPTLSPGLYVQMAGRGMRLKSHTDHCLVLDFANLVRTHGPIVAVQPPSKVGEGGEAPVKECPNCNELIHTSFKTCPVCGHEFEEKKSLVLKLRNDDIMGSKPIMMKVSNWRWMKHISKSNGKVMLRAVYYGGLSDMPVTEYFTILHQGYAGSRSREEVIGIMQDAGVKGQKFSSLEEAAEILTKGVPPSRIEYRKDGKFYRVLRREW